MVSKNRARLQRPACRGGQGFTLIELLVVVSIIGLLASIVVVALGTARQGGRDARAATDLRQIQIALELYYDAQSPNAYPALPDAFADVTNLSALNPYMDPVPLGTGVKNYQWRDAAGDDQKYCLRVELETGKIGSLSGDYYFVSNTGSQAGAVGTTCPN